MQAIVDTDALLNECKFEATRSSGKGGQNVNKVSTKVILIFNVQDSKVLSQEQKMIFINNLASRISKEDIFRISSGVERTQMGNRKRVIEKFLALIEKAFYTDEERIATKLPAAKKAKRKESKKAASEKKVSRSLQWDDSEGV